jgi:hypothetical protein
MKVDLVVFFNTKIRKAVLFVFGLVLLLSLLITAEMSKQFSWSPTGLYVFFVKDYVNYFQEIYFSIFKYGWSVFWLFIVFDLLKKIILLHLFGNFLRSFKVFIYSISVDLPAKLKEITQSFVAQTVPTAIGSIAKTAKKNTHSEIEDYGQQVEKNTQDLFNFTKNITLEPVRAVLLFGLAMLNLGINLIILETVFAVCSVYLPKIKLVTWQGLDVLNSQFGTLPSVGILLGIEVLIGLLFYVGFWYLITKENNLVIAWVGMAVFGLVWCLLLFAKGFFVSQPNSTVAVMVLTILSETIYLTCIVGITGALANSLQKIMFAKNINLKINS